MNGLKAVLMAAAFGFASAAQAHTAYLLPDDFSPEGANAPINAAFSTQFFSPEIGLSHVGVRAIGPDGLDGVFNSMQVQTQNSVFALVTSNYGTYRISTGEQLGRVATVVAVDGGWRPLAAGETPPEGAETRTLQAVTVAESYVTHGGPTRTAVDAAPGGRLAFKPITHPNQVLVAEGFDVQLLFDGQPFANVPIVLYGAGDPEANLSRVFVTDANGRAVVRVENAGQYLIAIRHRAEAPAGSEAQVRSYTTTLSFEALDALPAYAPPPPPPQPERRRRGSSVFGR